MSSAVPPEKSVDSPLTKMPGQNRGGNWLAMFDQQESVLILAFLLVLGGVTLLNRGFVDPTNLVDILYNSSYIGVAAVGMTMIILCGHIDIYARLLQASWR
jgi:ribose/xylose/arabinose/galactoside ABC-type transport system permease subunit